MTYGPVNSVVIKHESHPVLITKSFPVGTETKSPRYLPRVLRHTPSLAAAVTLNCERELFGVDHRRPLVLALFAPLAVAPPLPALAPEIGAAVHAGNVENGDAFQGDAAEVQSNAVTLGWEETETEGRGH